MYASRHCCTVLGQLNKHCRTCLLERLFVRPVSLMQALEGCTLRVILGKTRCGAFKPASAAKIWSTSMSREAVLVVPALSGRRPGNVLRVSRHLHHTRYVCSDSLSGRPGLHQHLLVQRPHIDWSTQAVRCRRQQSVYPYAAKASIVTLETGLEGFKLQTTRCPGLLAELSCAQVLNLLSFAHRTPLASWTDPPWATCIWSKPQARYYVWGS